MSFDDNASATSGLSYGVIVNTSSQSKKLHTHPMYLLMRDHICTCSLEMGCRLVSASIVE